MRLRVCFMETPRAMPWAIVPFILGMFILVESLTDIGWIETLAAAAASAVGTSQVRGVFAIGGTKASVLQREIHQAWTVPH